MTTYRTFPGSIMKKACKRLGVEVKFETFKSPSVAQNRLDELLQKGVPVGCQTGVYWLPYFPEGLRFHFNGHNIVVFKKEGKTYSISDPVLDEAVTCDSVSLEQARFALGPLAPKGKIYYIESIPCDLQLKQAIVSGIKDSCRQMTKPPIPFIGTRGIRFMGKNIAKWPTKLGPKEAAKRLGNVIRMQEEIGTGGGGFRFIYGAFLQEAAPILDDPEMLSFAEEITHIGDQWREFAAIAARNCRKRAEQSSDYNEIAERVLTCGNSEYGFFTKLLKHVEQRFK